jgi:hypothetical protein
MEGHRRGRAAEATHVEDQECGSRRCDEQGFAEQPGGSPLARIEGSHVSENLVSVWTR